MRRISSLFLLILVLFSCEKDKSAELSNSTNSGSVSITSKEDVDLSSLHPAATAYYQNIANLAQWYASHPDSRNNYLKKKSAGLSSDSVNVLLEKLLQISIIDSTDNELSIFELSPAERDSFLRDFVIIEANALNEKLLMDESNRSLAAITEVNEVYQEVNTQKKSASTTDPYWSMRAAMAQKEAATVSEIPPAVKKASDTYFWAQVIANGILKSSILRIAPNTLSANTFVQRVKASARKGRLLITLPGGTSTTSPIVFYPNKNWYDVGHVGIFSKNSDQIPSSVSRDFSFTIGTNPNDGMHDEKVGDSWSDMHGLSYVGQVFDVKWRWYKKNWYTWGWRRESIDVDNNKIYNKIVSVKGKPYCNAFQLLTAKLFAPDRFICSSSAWWCAKTGVDVNIGDWYKPTIFPGGVYLSDRVRIIDNTLR